MPVGEYLLEDGKLIVVEEEGTIADVREVSDEAPAKEEETEKEEETTSDLAEEKKEEEMADVADWEGMEKRIQNLEDAIADLKADKESKMQEEEMSNEVQAPLKSRTVKEEFSEVEKTELSEAAAKPIKHNPEAETKQIKRVEFGKGKFNTTFDKVMEQISKIKN